MYARSDRHGNKVTLNNRANAQADYLTKEQWNRTDTQNTDMLEAQALVIDIMKTHQRAPQSEEDINFSIDELITVIKRMKRRKAPGPDLWTADILKDLDDTNRIFLYELLEQWWEIEKIPKHAQRARVASIYKKGNPKLPSNYRPISLLSVFFKAFAAIIQRKLAAFIDHYLDGNQYGFRNKRKTSDALYIVRQLQSYVELSGLPGYIVLLDWEKVFD
jgi:hypothetical protein